MIPKCQLRQKKGKRKSVSTVGLKLTIFCLLGTALIHYTKHLIAYFVVRTYYGQYLKAESENQIAARAVFKILFPQHIIT